MKSQKKLKSGKNKPRQMNGMYVMIKRHSRTDKKHIIIDIIFKDYCKKLKLDDSYYVERKVDKLNRIYFRFYDNKKSNSEYRYKLFYRPGSEKFGDPLICEVNVESDVVEVAPYINKFGKYPVYYDAETDWYFIKYADCRARNLLETSTLSGDPVITSVQVAVDDSNIKFDTVKNLAYKFGLPSNYIYDLVHSNCIEYVKNGTSYFININSLVNYLLSEIKKFKGDKYGKI